jgi:thiol-disulfide isomerase/thioredoxin
MLHGQLTGGNGEQMIGLETLGEFTKAQLVKSLGGVDEDVAILFQTTENVHLVQQRGVLNDECIGLHDGLAQPDLFVVHPAKCHYGRTGSLGTKTGEGLRMAPPLESRDGEHFGAGYNALPSTPVYAYLEHAIPLFFTRDLTVRSDEIQSQNLKCALLGKQVLDLGQILCFAWFCDHWGMQTPNTPPHDEMLVACLCADWCGTCRDYQETFEQMQAQFPGARFVWIDVEDESELIDPIEVENFPTLLITRRDQAMFFGTVTPHVETLQRLIRTQLEDGARALPADEDRDGLAKRVWQQTILNK